jgi:hypothetical protein
MEGDKNTRPFFSCYCFGTENRAISVIGSYSDTILTNIKIHFSIIVYKKGFWRESKTSHNTFGYKYEKYVPAVILPFIERFMFQIFV